MRTVWLISAGVWLYLLLAILWFSPADPPSTAVAPLNDPVGNITGAFGAFAAYWGIAALGPGVWVFLIAGAGTLATTARGRSVDHPVVRVLGVCCLALAIGGLHALWMPEVGRLPGMKGGLVPLAVVEGPEAAPFGPAETRLEGRVLTVSAAPAEGAGWIGREDLRVTLIGPGAGAVEWKGCR